MSQSTLVDALRTIALLADKAVANEGVGDQRSAFAPRPFSLRQQQALQDIRRVALDAIHQTKGTKS